MSKRMFIVKDPQGLTHSILFESGLWHGCENLAHGFNNDLRGSVIREVQRSALAGLPSGAGFAIKEQP